MMSEKNAHISKRLRQVSFPEIMPLFSSVIFLGLAFYIAFFLDLPDGSRREDAYMIALLTGSYGLWKLWQGISKFRSKQGEV